MQDITEALRQHPSYQQTLQQHTALALHTSERSAGPLDLSPCLITASDLQNALLPPRLKLLDRWLCAADLGFIFAPRGVGKTWLAMALPLALSQGGSLGLWQAGEQPVTVLYVDGEMPLELTQQRTRLLGLGERVQYLHHETLFEALGCSLNIGLEEHREALTSLIVSHGFQCVILDNLSALASGVDENKGSDYEPIGQWLLELRRRKITVIVIHHAGRNGFMRGHSKREDACSWILELRNAKTDAEPGAKFTTHFAKPSRNTGQPIPDLLWHFTTSDEGLAHIDCQLAITSEYEQFIQHVNEGVEKQVDIAELMGKPKGTISKWAAKALEQGLISGSKNKLLPPKPKSSRDEDDD
ncbi:AAA domain-containing protein [Prosthecobacter debontii]|uniref:AAA domain-containing protein n=1 Tax=Prosthecobacter debontii TaxID=48467 RepID=A0A1T4YDD2_9BACT|nr:AAA family ATPase [Prosthecobacter debontii]SKA99837.1 AAA domain-containing protein [Prosthecobacter debontii]